MNTINFKFSLKKNILPFADIKNDYLFAIDKVGGVVGSKKYCNLKKDFKKIKMIMSQNNHLYEIIGEDVPLKLYFDLEAPLPEEETNFLNYRTYFMEFIKYILCNDFNLSEDSNRCIILDSCRKCKFSNHLIYDNIYFDNMSELKLFIQYLFQRLNEPRTEHEQFLFNRLFFTDNEKLKCIMDLIPYSKNQAIRMVNQSKIGTDYILKSVNKINDIMTTFISHSINAKYKIDSKILSSLMIENKPKKEKKQNTKEIKQNNDISPTQQININNWIDFKFNGITLMQSQNKNYDDLKKLELYKQYLYLIPSDQKCEHWINIGMAIKASGGVKDDWRLWSNIGSNNKNDKQLINNFDNFKSTGRTFNINTLKKLAKLSHPNYFKSEEELFRTYFNLNLDNIKVINEKSDFVSQEGTSDENNIFDDNKYMILYAYLGRGKTTAIKRLIKTKGYTRFLFISPRVSFSLFISKEFDIDNYTDALNEDEEKKVNIFTSKKLIISVESIQKININNNYQCIFLDESEAILNQFSSPTMSSKYLDCYNILINLIEKAEKVICADAFLTNRTINFMRSFNQPITMIKNNTSPIIRTAERMDLDNLEKSFIKDIKNKIKPYVCSSTKSTLQIIENGKKYEPEIFEKSLFYYGGYQREDKLFKSSLSNINQSWRDASFVATTPTNTVGCSFSPENKEENNFDLVYMVCPFPTCSVRDMMQMMMRVRHIKQNKMIFSLPSSKSNTKENHKNDIFYSSLENFENFNKDKLHIYVKTIEDFLKDEKADDEKNIQYGQLKAMKNTLENFEESPQALKEIIYFNLLEQYISNTYYEKMFYKFLDKCGYNYDPEFLTSKKNKDSDKINDNVFIEKYQKIDDIDEIDVERIIREEKKMNSSSIEKLQKEKYFFKKMINDDVLDLLNESKTFFNIYMNSYNKHYLTNIYEEKNLNITNILRREFIESNNLNEMLKFKSIKLTMINKIVKLLKIENSSDISTIIQRKDLDEAIDYINNNRKSIMMTFKIDDKLPIKIEKKDELKKILPYLKQILNNWSGVSLKTKEIDSHSKKPSKFILEGSDYNKLVKQIKRYEDDIGLFLDEGIDI